MLLNVNLKCLKSDNSDFTEGTIYIATEDIFQVSSNGDTYYFIERIGDYVRIVGNYENILFSIE